MHHFHFQNLGDSEETRMFLTRCVLRLVYLWKNIRIGMSPHCTVPTILQIIVRIMATSIQWFSIMHISTKHICIQVLRQLERPVLTLSIIIIEVNALLNHSQTNTMFIIINLQIFIRNSG